MSSDTSTIDRAKYQKQYDDCVSKQVDEHLSRLPNLIKKVSLWSFCWACLPNRLVNELAKRLTLILLLSLPLSPSPSSCSKKEAKFRMIRRVFSLFDLCKLVLGMKSMSCTVHYVFDLLSKGLQIDSHALNQVDLFEEEENIFLVFFKSKSINFMNYLFNISLHAVHLFFHLLFRESASYLNLLIGLVKRDRINFVCVRIFIWNRHWSPTISRRLEKWPMFIELPLNRRWWFWNFQIVC